MAEKLGEGGFGEVWLARDRAMSLRTTVFKFCTKKDKVKSLEREFDIFNKLAEKTGKTPPGIIEVLGAHCEKPPYYIQLEYASGGDLKRWINHEGKDAPLHIRLDLAIQMTRALAQIHDLKFVHRDIKPSNYLVEPSENPDAAPTLKISDFGIGQEAFDIALEKREDQEEIAGGGARFTLRTDTLLQAAGSYFFIAPELIVSLNSAPNTVAKRAQRPVDIYSLGVTLYQLFAGNTDVIPDPGLPAITDPFLKEDIGACLASDPKKRISTKELIQRLEQHGARHVEAEDAEKATLAAQARKLHVIIAVILTLLLLAIAGGIASWTLFTRAEKALKQTIHSQKQMETELYYSHILLAQRYMKDRQYDLARQFLADAPERLRNWEWGYLTAKTESAILTIDSGNGAMTSAFAISPNASTIAIATAKAPPSLFRTANGERILTLAARKSALRSMTFDSAGKRLLATYKDDTARVWDIEGGGAEIACFQGHSATILAADLTDDGTRAATGSDDNTVYVWPVDDPGTSVSMIGHSAAVTLVRFGPRAERLLTASDDGTARLWDTTTGNELRAFPGHICGVADARFSPDGQRVIIAGDFTARIWDATQEHPPLPLIGHSNTVLTASFSPDGTRALTTSADGTAQIWDAKTGDPLHTLAQEPYETTLAKWSKDSLSVVTASADAVAQKWDATNGALLFAAEGHSGHLIDALFHPNNNTIITASADGTIKVWDPLNQRHRAALKGHTEKIVDACFSPDGKLLATASADFTARLWDIRAGKEIVVMTEHEYALCSIEFSPNGAFLLTSSHDNFAKLWHVPTGHSLRTLSDHKASVENATFSPNGKTILTASDKTLRTFDAATGDLQQKRDTGKRLLRADFSPDGKWIAAIPSSSTIEIRDSRNCEIVALLKSHTERAAAAFSPDSKSFATGGSGGKVRIWDIPSGALRLPLDAGSEKILFVDFSPNGNLLLVASDNCDVWLWNAKTGERVRELKGHDLPAVDASFSPDGSRLLTTSLSGLVRLFDVTTGREILAINSETESARLARFSPDGSTIFIGSESGAALLLRSPARSKTPPAQPSSF